MLTPETLAWCSGIGKVVTGCTVDDADMVDKRTLTYFTERCFEIDVTKLYHPHLRGNFYSNMVIVTRPLAECWTCAKAIENEPCVTDGGLAMANKGVEVNNTWKNEQIKQKCAFFNT